MSPAVGLWLAGAAFGVVGGVSLARERRTDADSTWTTVCIPAALFCAVFALLLGWAS